MTIAESPLVSADEASSPSDMSTLMCLFCEFVYNYESSNFDGYLHHLLTQHKFIIGDFKVIHDFPKYVEYWRGRFTDKNLLEFCAVIKTNSKTTDIAPSELYYLLCDKLSEDHELRVQLQTDKLCEVLEQQQREREDSTLTQDCLFCRHQFSADRAAVFNHMNDNHNFNIGHPDNLVYVEKLMTSLHDKMNKLLCLFCDKTFRNRHILKEHMRKKQHKRINPYNNTYDQYYVVNYLEIGKTWEDIQSENESETELHHMAEGWNELTNRVSDLSTCLFCLYGNESSAVFNHMKKVHTFDFETDEKFPKLQFHERVKVINCIRRQIQEQICPMCEAALDTDKALQEHFSENPGCTHIPARDLWDDPQYFFSTNENDSLLYSLEKMDAIDTTVVIPEDIPFEQLKQQSVLSDMDISELR